MLNIVNIFKLIGDETDFLDELKKKVKNTLLTFLAPEEDTINFFTSSIDHRL